MENFDQHIQFCLDKNRITLERALALEGIHITAEQAIETMIEADPTENKNLVDWMVKSYCMGGFLWEDISAGSSSKVTETLENYLRNRGQLEPERRNIYNYASLGSVWHAIESFCVFPDIQKKLEDKTGKEIKRSIKNTALLQSRILYTSPEITIAVPLTEFASNWWGKGTRWCTAATKSENFFQNYNDIAPLYVAVLSNVSPPVKVQFWEHKAGVAWMDQTDQNITPDFVRENWSFIKPMVDVFLKLNGNFLKYLPKELLDEESINTAMASSNIDLASHINSDDPNPSTWSKEHWKQAVMSNPRNYFHIPKEFLDKEIYETVIENNIISLESVPKEFRTVKMFKITIQHNPESIKDLPDKMLSEKICLSAVEKQGYAIRWVPDKYRSDRVIKAAIEQNGSVLGVLKEKEKTFERCMLAIEKDGKALEHLPKKYINLETCKRAIEQNGFAIRSTPKGFINSQLYRMALSSAPKVIKDIPRHRVTDEFMRIAITNDGTLLDIVEWDKRDIELSLLAVKQNGTALKYVPGHLRTLEICNIAVDNNSSALDYVPEELVDQVNSYDISKLRSIVSSIRWDTSILDRLKQEFRESFETSLDKQRSISNGR